MWMSFPTTLHTIVKPGLSINLLVTLHHIHNVINCVLMMVMDAVKETIADIPSVGPLAE